ncbi:MAG TPA: DUF1905 domain-containing protein [Methylomirabilota bacterium]|nr:DUF1905 domain-containing protein [Methylomirabilota bacterium]
MIKFEGVLTSTPRGGGGTYCLGVAKEIQKAAGVGLGDTIEVFIERLKGG